jgi:DNA topoisomerase-3
VQKQPLKRLWLQSMTAQSDSHRLREPAQRRRDAAALGRRDSPAARRLARRHQLHARPHLLQHARHGRLPEDHAAACRRPTLAILVEREEKVRAFVPRDYFEVLADFGVTDGSYRGRWFDRAISRRARTRTPGGTHLGA